MNSIKIQTPAKINLTLEVQNRRPDGFHNIQSIMQTVNLFDYLNISFTDIENVDNEILVSGNSTEIPYDSNNLVYKAAQLFLSESDITNKKIVITIEKNIPVSAGLAGGSSNAAGTFVGLNDLFGKPLSVNDIESLASQLGSDLNFLLQGGACLATSRGEEIRKISSQCYMDIVIVKPKSISISAKEAYVKYSELRNKPIGKNTDKMLVSLAMDNLKSTVSLLNNDLEKAIIRDYSVIDDVKQQLLDVGCIGAIMSGSGPSVFGIYNGDINLDIFNDDYEVFKVNTISDGVCRVT